MRDFTKSPCHELNFALWLTNQRFHAGIVTCQNSNFYSDTVAQEKEAREDRAKLEEKEKYEVVSLSLYILT